MRHLPFCHPGLEPGSRCPSTAAAEVGPRLKAGVTMGITTLLLATLPLPAQAVTPDLLAYLQGRAADGDGDSDLAARRYSAALDASPGDPTVAAFAYREAIAAGDIELALRAATALGAAAPADADLLIVADAAARDDRAAADQAIVRLSKSRLAILAAPLAAWAEYDRGGDPLPLLAVARDDVVARRFASEARGLILIAQGHTGEGIATLRAILGTGQASEDLRIIAARLLVGQGKAAEARSFLTGKAAPIATMRARLGDGAKPSLAFGASALFSRVASDLALGPAGPLPLALAQAALVADPQNDRARVLLGYTLGRSGNTDRALATLDAVPAASPYAGTARASRIQILADAGDTERALADAKALAKDDDPVAQQRYADLLMAAGRPKDAAAIYRNIVDQSKTDQWTLWLQYGGALDEAGDWPRARKALERAVALAPDEPLALNYLGYARITHGEEIAASEALLEKASRLRPDDAAIADSLGWAYHLSGKPAQALPLIEQAAAAAPDNAEIGEHLGDILWSVGRRFEARYAWTAAQVVASDDEAARLAGKIANGPTQNK